MTAIETKSIAVVGSGYWGKNLVRNFHQLQVLHSICDSNQTTLDEFARHYPNTLTTTSFADILANSSIKGIVIATPAETHFSLAQQAIEASKDVYVEKPLCLSERDGAELNRLAVEKQTILMTGHLLWYHPAVVMLKKMINQGELGRIQYIYSNRLNLGKLRREENVLWSFAPHDISVIIGLVNEMPISVQAQGGNYLHQQIADTTVTMFDFPSGVKAHIFVSWLHPFKEQKLILVGDKKMAVFDDTAAWPNKLVLYPHSIGWSDNVPIATKANAQPVEIPEEEPLKNECAHFLKCIATRKQPYTDGEEGLRVLKILNRCQEALECGSKIQINKEQSSPSVTGIYVHPSAVVDKNVSIGEGTKIWHFSHLLPDCQIGKNCSIGQNVVISNGVTVGNGCKIQNNVSVYEAVTLEDNVFCGPSMVFTNVYNPRCEFPRKNAYRPTLVKKGATLGANSTIVCGTTIGQYAFIGAGAVVTSNVPDFALMVGNPAKQIGWMSRYGERLDIPLEANGETTCPHTGDRYQLKSGKVSFI